ncbi:FAD binding domain-containing protein [Haloarchaeobius sp. HRN-SO-5]|uniref:FAD binding domain-containing protein n=1 Tax=Haloarchaeobius sp. HRN-SO-5 TaxID=3446118 RepID=UPI003EBB7452
MYPEPFDYYRAETVEEALSLLDEHADSNPAVLSGGHSLVPTMKSGLASPDVVVDIGDIDAISGVDTGDGTLEVGACTRYETVVDNETVLAGAPLLAEATAEIGDKQVRSRGTVGGNIAHADPASDLPAVMLATDATIHAQGPDGTRSIPADEFFLGIYMTALSHDELLTGISIPTVDEGTSAYVKKESPSSGYAMIGVAVRIQTADGTVSDAGVAANGAKNYAVRLDAVESLLEGRRPDDISAAAAGEKAMDGIAVEEMMDDIQASQSYRAQLLESYTKRAVETALDRL